MTSPRADFARSASALSWPAPWIDAPVLLMTACDVGYLSHALALARSLDAVAPGSHLMLHVINPDEAALERVAATAATLQQTRLHVSSEKVRLPSGANKAAYYASARFLRMAEVLNLRGSVPVLALDADALAVGPLALDFSDKAEAEICLRRRASDAGVAVHLQVAAGAVWARSTPRSRAFFDAVSTELTRRFADGDAEWFVDQEVLARHVREATAEAKVRNLKTKFADWTFRDDAVFWMGKGTRKYVDVRYVALRDSYDEDPTVRDAGRLLLRRCRARIGAAQADRVLDGALARLPRARGPRVAILLPRLDLPWKASGLGRDGRPPPPTAETVDLRLWWKRFTIALAHELTAAGAQVELLELPAWEITPERVDMRALDLAFVPHRCHLDFGPTRTPRLFYMQQYLRQAFVVDAMGWGPGSSRYPLRPDELPPSVLGAWDTYRAAMLDGSLDSKFGQSDRQAPERLRMQGRLPDGDFIFMPLQIPHDQSIRYFSDVDMDTAVDATLELARSTGRTLVLKPHPANRESMRALQARVCGPGVLWSDAHVHDLLAAAEGVVTINSGVGFEALLAGRPVVCLGRADYDAVVQSATPTTLGERYAAAIAEDAATRLRRYARFVDWFLGRYSVDLARPVAGRAVLSRIVAQALGANDAYREPVLPAEVDS